MKNILADTDYGVDAAPASASSETPDTTAETLASSSCHQPQLPYSTRESHLHPVVSSTRAPQPYSHPEIACFGPRLQFLKSKNTFSILTTILFRILFLATY